MILTSLLGQTVNGYYLQHSCLPTTIEVLVSHSALAEGSAEDAASFQEPYLTFVYPESLGSLHKTISVNWPEVQPEHPGFRHSHQVLTHS